MKETWVQSLGPEDPMEEGMATPSSIFAWRIPWTEEPGGQEVRNHGGQKDSNTNERPTHFRTSE